MGHSRRFYRNGAISFMVLAICLGAALFARRSPLHLLWILPLFYVGVAVLDACRLTHPRFRLPRRRSSAAGEDGDYERVRFPGPDGLTLSGLYAPGRNGALIILTHAWGMEGAAMKDHAAPLRRQGYGLLLLDLRAHGQSEGDTCTAGWREADDLLAAIGYVRDREADAVRIGVLGISLGARAALHAAARSEAIGAVVAEGPGPAAASDYEGRVRRPLAAFSGALLSLMNGAKVPPGLLSAAGRIAPRPLLLISAGTGREQAWMRRLYRAAQEPRELWSLPEAGHGAGLLVYPRLYAQRIVEFFDTTL